MNRSHVVSVALVGVFAVVVSACGGSTSNDTRVLDAAKIPDKLVVTSPEFADNGAIPRANTCDGPGTPPTISWTAVPHDTKEVAVVVDDPDAAKGPFLHWLVIGLAAKAGSVPSRAPGVIQLDNTGGTLGWTPPCPPAGSLHHFHFSVYALSDYVCADNGDATNGPGCAAPASVQALTQITGSAIAKGVLVGTYKR